MAGSGDAGRDQEAWWDLRPVVAVDVVPGRPQADTVWPGVGDLDERNVQVGLGWSLDPQPQILARGRRQPATRRHQTVVAFIPRARTRNLTRRSDLAPVSR